MTTLLPIRWYWFTLKRPLPVWMGDEPGPYYWGGIYGLAVGNLFIGITRRWTGDAPWTPEIKVRERAS